MNPNHLLGIAESVKNISYLSSLYDNLPKEVKEQNENKRPENRESSIKTNVEPINDFIDDKKIELMNNDDIKRSEGSKETNNSISLFKLKTNVFNIETNPFEI